MVLVMMGGSGSALSGPDAHERLQALANLASADVMTDYEVVHTQFDGDGVSRQLLTFQSDQLTQFALLLRPASEQPEKGWPVVIFNHGTHPNPPQYGKNAEGEDSRPGDYYRALVQAYVLSGFAVLAPDHRGHNTSQGFHFTQSPQNNYWYARDTITATLGLASMDDLDLNRLYMAGHSRGGRITQLASAALGERLQAVSVWSTGATQTAVPDSMLGSQAPMIIQHGSHDSVTLVMNSRALAQGLSRLGRFYELHEYDTQKHLFQGHNFERAIKKDVRWFNTHP